MNHMEKDPGISRVESLRQSRLCELLPLRCKQRGSSRAVAENETHDWALNIGAGEEGQSGLSRQPDGTAPTLVWRWVPLATRSAA